jgi:pilus assembly protein CpaB
MGRRTLLLIAALVVAALGTALVFIYVNNADNRAQADATLVKVLVATQDVAAGTTAADASADGAFDIQEVSDASLATGALSDISAISDQVALAPIFEGQQILTQMFGSVATTSALSVGKGEIAIAVELGDPNRVAGFVEPGSQVAVFATVEGANQEQETRVLLTRSDVIAVGASTVTTQTTTDNSGESTTEEISRAILTLALTQTDAQRIIFAQEQGPLYFGLLPQGTDVKPGGPINAQNLFN